MNNPRRFILSATVAAVAIIGVAAAREGRVVSRLAPSSALATASAAPSGSAPTWATQPSTSSLSYDVRSETEIELGGDDAGTRTRLGIGLVGRCTFDPLSDVAGVVEVKGQCPQIALELTGSSTQAFSENARALVEQQLQTPFFFTRAADGRVVRAALAGGLDPLVAGLVRALVAGLQVVRPADGSTTWDAQEIDATGPHTASYVQAMNGGLEKRRHDYRTALRADGTPAVTGTVQARIELEPDGAIRSLDERGSFAARADVGLPATVQTRVRASLVGRAQFTVSAAERSTQLALRATFVSGPLDSLPISPAAKNQRDQKLVNGASLTDLIDAWDELPLDDIDAWGLQRARLQARVEALLRLDPSAAARVASSLHDGVDDDLAATLTAALATAATTPAQQALADIARDVALSSAQRQQATAELGMVAHPTTDTLIGLEDAMTDLPPGSERSTTALALGNAASGARKVAGEAGSPEASAAFDALVRALDEATLLDDKLALWLALENTGDPRLLDVVQARLSNPDDLLRSAAAGALRLVFTPPADALLLRLTATNDPALAVAAARALRDRPALPRLAGIDSGLQHGQVARARLELVAWLAPDAKDDAVAALLARTAANDPSDDVRAHAAQLL